MNVQKFTSLYVVENQNSDHYGPKTGVLISLFLSLRVDVSHYQNQEDWTGLKTCNKALQYIQASKLPIPYVRLTSDKLTKSFQRQQKSENWTETNMSIQPLFLLVFNSIYQIGAPTERRLIRSSSSEKGSSQGTERQWFMKDIEPLNLYHWMQYTILCFWILLSRHIPLSFLSFSRRTLHHKLQRAYTD